MTAVPVPGRRAAPLAGVGAIAVGVATAFAIVGLSIALFFNPVWVAFEQERTRADYWTGYPMDQVHAVTNDVLREVYLGPGTFAQVVNGARLFTADESSHMADVRGVVVGFFLLAIVAAGVVLATGLASRGAAWWWRAVSRGAGLLAIGAAIVGAAFALFFDQAFTIFHRIFFPQGNWAFAGDSNLLRLFPDAFWTETSVAIALAGIALTTATWAFARRRAARAGWARRPERVATPPAKGA